MQTLMVVQMQQEQVVVNLSTSHGSILSLKCFNHHVVLPFGCLRICLLDQGYRRQGNTRHLSIEMSGLFILWGTLIHCIGTKLTMKWTDVNDMFLSVELTDVSVNYDG